MGSKGAFVWVLTLGSTSSAMPLDALLPLGIISAAIGVAGSLLYVIPYATRGEGRFSPHVSAQTAMWLPHCGTAACAGRLHTPVVP